MKKLFTLSIVLALVVGCATLVPPSKTTNGYIYTSTINPDDIFNGKYNVIDSGLLNPWTAIALYYQPEKDRIVVVFFMANNIGEWRIFRYLYAEKDALMVFQVNDESKKYEAVDPKSLDIDEAEFVARLKNDLANHKKEQKL